jgi:hypothetical protein
MAGGGSSGTRAMKETAAFKDEHKEVGGWFLAREGNQAAAWAAAWPEYGRRGGDVRRPSTNGARRFPPSDR